MGGTLEYLSGLLGGSGGHGHDKMTRRKQLQTVELKVRMDCEGCELKVRSALSSMKVKVPGAPTEGPAPASGSAPAASSPGASKSAAARSPVSAFAVVAAVAAPLLSYYYL